ncbi:MULTISPECIES: helix-turn-helix domain-containing protein [unclassified Streptomyces]|uniref:helix-turn-helix domain-containing protein n=1 Tax=unclassified Streptomyces TaxID=2593676 RepID=UPI0033193300
MSAEFGPRLRALLTERGMTLRGTARALNYNVAYISRVANGHQRPSAQLAEALDKLLQADGELVRDSAPVAPNEPPGPASDIAHMKASAEHILKHADHYGGDAVAPVAVQVWQSAQRKLDAGEIPEPAQRGYVAALAEAAEVAGWLLFDSGDWVAARNAFLESHMLARHAGERPMEWFALDMLAMLDTECSRPGGVRRITDELLAQPRIPPRVALLARVRRGRALAQIGDRQRALTDLDAARGGAEESLSPRDPKWAWWVNQQEIGGHSGHALLSLAELNAAIFKFQSALEHATPRGVMLYRIELLHSYARAKAWREAEEEIQEISPLLSTITSGRNRLLLRDALRVVERTSGVPVGLSALVRDTAATITP